MDLKVGTIDHFTCTFSPLGPSRSWGQTINFRKRGYRSSKAICPWGLLQRGLRSARFDSNRSEGLIFIGIKCACLQDEEMERERERERERKRECVKDTKRNTVKKSKKKEKVRGADEKKE